LTRATDALSPSSHRLRGGYRAVSSRLVDLDGDGTKSRLILLRKVEEHRRDAESSDELRIYDVNASRLKLTFSFRPLAPLFAASPRAGWPDQLDRVGSYDFQLTDARDLDGNGTVEPILQVIDHPPSGRPDPVSEPSAHAAFHARLGFRRRGLSLRPAHHRRSRKPRPRVDQRQARQLDSRDLRRRRDRRPHVARRPLLAAAFSDDAAGQADDPFTLRRYRVRLWRLSRTASGSRSCRATSLRPTDG
jgi:hypothetical protein